MCLVCCDKYRKVVPYMYLAAVTATAFDRQQKRHSDIELTHCFQLTLSHSFSCLVAETEQYISVSCPRAGPQIFVLLPPLRNCGVVLGFQDRQVCMRRGLL